MEQWSGTECARNPGKPDPSLAAGRQSERGERPDKKKSDKNGGFCVVFRVVEKIERFQYNI